MQSAFRFCQVMDYDSSHFDIDSSMQNAGKRALRAHDIQSKVCIWLGPWGATSFDTYSVNVKHSDEMAVAKHLDMMIGEDNSW